MEKEIIIRNIEQLKTMGYKVEEIPFFNITYVMFSTDGDYHVKVRIQTEQLAISNVVPFIVREINGHIREDL